MAKGSQKVTAEQDGEISFTMVKFSMKASDTSLQKGMDAIKSAFAQAGFIAAPEQRLPRSATKQLSNGSPAEVEEESVADDVIETEATAVEEAAVVTPRTPRTKPKIKNYTAIADPGFSSVSPTLKEFAEKTSPTSDMKKLLVIAYWFKHHLKQSNVTNEAFYTAFREVQWTVPSDIGQNVRELRSQRDQRLTKGSDPKSSAIALLGENDVDRLLKGEA